MRLSIKILFFFILLFFKFKIMAQADISMVTHWYNRANYNPAFITRTDYVYLFSNFRQQWLGIDGAPQVINLQASEYIHSIRSAFGVSFVGDKIGVTRTYNPMLSYAFRLAKDDELSFSMGLSAGLFTRSLNGSLFEADDESDPTLFYHKENIYKPDANLGFEFQNSHFIVGLSSTHLFSIFNPSDILAYSNHRFGYVIYKNYNQQLINYSFGFQAVNRSKLTVYEGNITVRLKHQTGLLLGAKEIIDLGVTYRSTRQLTLLIGVNLTPDIRFGYAYDQSFRTGFLGNGTHEIMLEYRIPNLASTTKLRCEDAIFWYR